MRLRVRLQITAEGIHASQQALAVIEAVHANELVAAAERLRAFARTRGCPGAVNAIAVELVDVDADRERAGVHLAAESGDARCRATAPP